MDGIVLANLLSTKVRRGSDGEQPLLVQFLWHPGLSQLAAMSREMRRSVCFGLAAFSAKSTSRSAV
jgi:hypothetical protein